MIGHNSEQLYSKCFTSKIVSHSTAWLAASQLFHSFALLENDLSITSILRYFILSNKLV